MNQLQRIYDRFYKLRRTVGTWALFALAAMLAFHVVFGANGWMVYHKKKMEYRKVNEDILRIKTENEMLHKNIEALQTDPKAIEKEAREQLKYTKPGEVVYVLPAPPQQAPTANAQNKPTK
jgi:cell division protein FtsB